MLVCALCFVLDALSNDEYSLKRFAKLLHLCQLRSVSVAKGILCCEPNSALLVSALPEHPQPQPAAYLTRPLQGLPEVRNEPVQSVLPPLSAGSKGVALVPLMSM